MFWTSQPSVNIGLLLILGCCLQGQGHSEGSYPQSALIFLSWTADSFVTKLRLYHKCIVSHTYKKDRKEKKKERENVWSFKMEELGVLFHPSLFQILSWTLLWSLLAQGWGWVGGGGLGGPVSYYLKKKISVELLFEACWHCFAWPLFTAHAYWCQRNVSASHPGARRGAVPSQRGQSVSGERQSGAQPSYCDHPQRQPHDLGNTEPGLSLHHSWCHGCCWWGKSESPGLLKALSGSGRVHGSCCWWPSVLCYAVITFSSFPRLGCITVPRHRFFFLPSVPSSSSFFVWSHFT